MAEPALRVMVNEQLMNTTQALDAARAYLDRSSGMRSREESARAAGVSRAALGRAIKIVRDGAPELQAAVANGAITLSAAGEITRLPPSEQAAAVRAAQNGRTSPRVTRDKPVQVTEAILQQLAGTFDTLAMVLRDVDGLDRQITAPSAEAWVNRLARKSQTFRSIMSMLRERAK